MFSILSKHKTTAPTLIMKVCIAEKPSVAREIAKILGANTKKDGFFEGEGYAVTWTFGHFCTLYTPDNYHPEWKSWSLQSLPMLPEKFETRLIDNKGVKKQFKIIKQLFSKAILVINCGDAGQEGELIQRWVIKQANYNGPVKRLWISSLTAEAIKDGFLNLKDAADFNNLFYAGSSRAIGDWLLGMNATRLFTLKYGAYKQVLSIGRVQTPTLAMLVERHKAIESFQPEAYWEIQTIYRDTVFNCTKGRFKNKEKADELMKGLEDKLFIVEDVQQKNGKEHAPKLFDLTSLQVYCNSKFGFTADFTLKIVQQLYEKKLVSYPRVDTTFLPDDLYPKIAPTLRGLKSYAPLTSPLLQQKIPKTSRVFNNKKVTDHHAIIPTGYQSSIQGELLKVYDIICRRFIAAFYPVCKVSNTIVLGKVDEVQFKATGKEIIDAGWRVCFPVDTSKNKKEEEKILPNFVVGESGVHQPSLLEKQTKPPKLYSEASLLRAMETAGKQIEDETLRELMKVNGIGRPSTRANIIETLHKRKYIQRKKKQLIPTLTGIQLIETIKHPLLKSAELTGQWEKQLKEIEAGNYKAGQFILDMKKMVYQIVKNVKEDHQGRKIAPPVAVKASKTPKQPRTSKKSTENLSCPKCSEGKLLKGKSNYGCSRWKEGCQFMIPFKFKEKKLSNTQLIRLVQQKSTVELKGFKENGQSVKGKIVLNDAAELVFEPSVSKQENSSASIACPTCQKGTVIRGKKAYGCSRWKEGCDFRYDYDKIRAKAAGRALSKDLVLSIISNKTD